ncbi:MAG: F0F1 ATP synthase subunit B [Gammaproteobacteria bacterium]|nr:F0F1 ATP synthase subunit B [Gammaproteobacteria bacterium]
MDINITLLGEVITFAVLIWVTMKYVWPPLAGAMEERQKKIAAGLEAAERGQKDLVLAQQKITEELRHAKNQATAIIDKAELEVNKLIEDGRAKAQIEGEKLIALAKNNIEHEVTKAKTILQKQTVEIAIKAAEKILQSKIDAGEQQKLIEQLIEEI